MSKKGTKALASATLLSLVLTTALSAGPVKAASAGQVTATRTSGADRYETAATVATKNWTTSDNVVLVDGEGYADAVSASVLAKTLNAPILLTQSGTLNSDAATALSTLKAKNVYVIGGTASVAQSVRDGLKTSGYNLIELGGANRYETNVAVANELVKNHGVSPANVMVVGGEGFSDALSVAPVAATKGQILLLGSNSQSDMQSVIDFVNSNKSKATVVGTSYVMSDSILKALGVDPSTRVNGGADRFATNLNVLNAFKDSLNPANIYVANATADDGYADALVASALAGKSAAPLVLVDTDTSSATQNALDYIGKEEATTTSTSINVVGGTGVVSDSLYQKLGGTITPTPTNDNTVNSISATALNQIKITFNTDLDEDSAESIGNYKIDGTTLTDADATAVLGDDNRTVLVTLKTPKDQGKAYTVSVKNGVLTADKTESIAAKDESVTFSDLTAPTVSSVVPKGNSKLTVNFSEPVKIPVTTSGSITPTPGFTSKFRINSQNISSFGLSTNYTVVKHNTQTISDGKGGYYVWADRVDFYFASKLPAGSNTLEVNDGSSTDGILVNAADWILKDQTQDFTIDTVSTKPTATVTADTDGTLWVKFDRPMDSATALIAGNYKLNGTTLTVPNSALEFKDGDKTVKIKDVPNIPFGSNSLQITTNVKDAYGNTVDDDTSIGFTMAKDETKPTVKSVSMIDSDTIRLVFSKDIDKTYATQLANYTLKDSSGVDISSHIRLVKPANQSDTDDEQYSDIIATNSSKTGSGTILANDWSSDNVWDIKMWKYSGETSNNGDDWRLTGSKYTLTVKNLVDTTANKNVMDDWTQDITGTDDVAPKMGSTAYKKSGTSNNANHKVILTFSEAMDSSTLNDVSNYQYKNASGDSKSLPSGTTVTPGNDDKSVTIEFPTDYYIYDSNTNNTTDSAINASYKTDDNSALVSNLDSDNKVTGILASGLKDVSGNSIDSFNNSASVAYTGSGNFSYKANTYRIVNSNNGTGDDLEVRLQFSNSIDPDTIQPQYFTVAGLQPDSVRIDGSDLVLAFNKGDSAISSTTAGAIYAGDLSTNATNNVDKLNKIKSQGANAQVTITSDVKDITGADYADSTTTIAANVFNYESAPKTTSDYWYAVTGVTNDAGTTSGAAIVLTFDNAIDPVYSSVRPDDYTFELSGVGSVKADHAYIAGNSLVFKFNDGTKFTSGNTLGVALKSGSPLDVESLKDANGDETKYVPSTDDSTKTRQVKIVGSGDTVNGVSASSTVNLIDLVKANQTTF